ncbi:class I SAM-dependent methyltransferase [Actinokineospora guangxiensis]|uniref:Class I SAM-dependent methyltransferase n=1 Tax=Actinokineospora guangxiensis TaxID=1490288 RepID=A0ABW0EM87_9PSEU
MSFEEVRRDWTLLGESDPLWAVYVAPGKRGGRWDVEQFLALGRADVAAERARLAELGRPTSWERALDFGCGAGRLSQALAEHAGSVVGVDVSAPMLATARSLDRSGGRCEFVLNDAPDLRRFADGSFDLVYTALVLQHLPRPVIEGYLPEFVRVLAPGGTGVLHCSTSPLWTVKGTIWRLAPSRLIGLGQRLFLGYPAPMRMTALPERRVEELVRAAGGTVLSKRAEDDRSTHWRLTTYVVGKPL